MSRKSNDYYNKFKNKEWLEKQYIILHKSYKQIESEFGIGVNTLCKWMKEFGIKARNCSESHLGKKYNIPEDVLKLRGERISKALTGKMVGEKNPFYGKHHTEETKEHLRKIKKGYKLGRRKFKEKSGLGYEKNLLYYEWKFFIYNESKQQEIKSAITDFPIYQEWKIFILYTYKTNIYKSRRGRHYTKTPETLIKLSIAKKGKCSPKNYEQLARLRKQWDDDPGHKIRHKEAMDRYWATNPDTSKYACKGKENGNYGKQTSGHGRAHGSYFKCSDENIIWLRSTYELRVAIAFTKLNIPWVYEPIAFELHSINTTYRPDFLVNNNIWIEVKGYLSLASKIKMIEFAKVYPDKILRILYLDDIIELECYADNKWDFDILKLGSDIRDN